MSDPLTATVREWLRRAADDLIAAAADLTELDARIGDGDHGINLRRGMQGVSSVLDESGLDVGSAELLRHVGRRIVSVVGGASGPLYGTLFLTAGEELGETPSCAEDLAVALERGVVAVGRRGRSQVGQKTMLDTLAPATAAFASSLRSGDSPREAGSLAVSAARAGRDGTRGMIAQRGRASYLGERSRGHLDPGAVSACILVAALADALVDHPAAVATGTSR